MLRRILSLLGLGWHLPAPSLLGPAPGAPPETDGEATFSFTPGAKAAFDKGEESQDERRKRITDDDLVWPGKATTIYVRNEEPTVFRYALTVTDLDPSLYVERPPEGGLLQRDGSVLLPPGEEAAFEVCFAPPPSGRRARAQTFSAVISRFDPRRSNDPGLILGEEVMRWVNLPQPGDVQIDARPREVVLRPWRCAALFALTLHNKSYLPPTAQLQLLRAPTREALAQKPEPVGTVRQSLEPGAGGVWHCLLPRFRQRGSYFATVTGAACFTESVEHRLALPQPVHVRYIPWLRLGRDWAFLAASLLGLVWLAWGIPIPKTPVVTVPLTFAGLAEGSVPEGAAWKDLQATLFLLNDKGNKIPGQDFAGKLFLLDEKGRKTSGKNVGAVVKQGGFEFTNLPTRLYWIRWPFGSRIVWNGRSRQPQSFLVEVKPKPDSDGPFQKYNLNALQSQDDSETLAFTVSDAPRVFGDWTTIAPLKVALMKGVIVKIRLGGSGALPNKNLREITLNYTLEGREKQTRVLPVLRDPTTGLMQPLSLTLTKEVEPGAQPFLTVEAEAPLLRSHPVAPQQVRHRDQPFWFTLVLSRDPVAIVEKAADPKTLPPAQQPPATLPAQQPSVAPPARPPAVKPPSVKPPPGELPVWPSVAEPRSMESPAEKPPPEPPAVTPPAPPTEPPAQEPPSVDPPSVDPPSVEGPPRPVANPQTRQERIINDKAALAFYGHRTSEYMAQASSAKRRGDAAQEQQHRERARLYRSEASKYKRQLDQARRQRR